MSRAAEPAAPPVRHPECGQLRPLNRARIEELWPAARDRLAARGWVEPMRQMALFSPQGARHALAAASTKESTSPMENRNGR